MHFLLMTYRCRTFEVVRSFASQLRPFTASRFCTAASPAEDEHSRSKTLNPGWLDIRVGQIASIRKHPDAAKLFIEEVNVGEPKPRTIVSGLVAYCRESDLLHRNVLVLCNLRPAKLIGIISHGMVLCASGKESVEPLDPPPDSVPGDKASFNGYEATRPLAILHPKKKIWEQVQATGFLTNFELCFELIWEPRHPCSWVVPVYIFAPTIRHNDTFLPAGHLDSFYFRRILFFVFLKKDFTVSSESIAQWKGNQLVTKMGIVRCKSLANADISGDSSLGLAVTQADEPVSRTTDGTAMFCCPRCQFAYQKESSLLLHIAHVHESKRFFCKHCDAGYVTLSGLCKHVIQVHKRLHVCPECEKSCNSPSHLRNHVQQVHGIEKPFVCPVCGDAFKTKACLAQHGSFHATYKPVVCKLCARHFYKSAELTRHMSLHTNVTDYHCPICCCYFVSHRVLKLHQSREHKLRSKRYKNVKAAGGSTDST